MFNFTSNTKIRYQQWQNLKDLIVSRVGKSVSKCPFTHTGLRIQIGDLPGDPVVRSPCFHHSGQGSDPSRGNKIPYAARYDQKSFKIHNERKNINWDRLLEREFDSMKFSSMKILNAYTL